MTETIGRIGFGLNVQRETNTPGTFADIGQIVDGTPPGTTLETVDATHHKSEGGYREHIAALLSQKDASLVIHYPLGGTTHAQLLADQEARTARNFKFLFPDEEDEVVFKAFISDLTPATPLADKMTLSATFKPTGKPTWA